MGSTDGTTVVAMVRAMPVRAALFAGCPLVVAAVQLLNSYLNGLSWLVSVPFAAVMVAFAVVLVQHQFARYRRRQLQRGRSAAPAD